MRKLINLCKKPFLITSVVLTVVALVALIVVCCVPHGGTYTYSDTVAGVKYEMTSTFKGDKIAVNMKVDGKEYDMGEQSEMAYKIKDGKLYMVYEGVMSPEPFGKINSFEFVCDSMFGEGTMTFKCNANIAIMIASAIVAGLGALMTAFCVTILVLDRKGKFNA